MTLLVTGGCGFIGSHLVAALAADGREVRVLDHAEPSERISGVDYRQGSVTDRDAVRGALKGVSGVYHLAAYPHLWAPDKSVFETVNVGGTRVVVEEAKAAGCERFHYLSSPTVLIGANTPRRGVTVDETTMLPERQMLGPYPRSKLRAEALVRAVHSRSFETKIAVPTVPLGPGDHNLTPPTRMLVDLLNGAVPAVLECDFNFVDVRDLARGLILVGEQGDPGERYLLAGQDIAMRDFLSLLEDVSGRGMPKRRVPYAVAWLAALVSEFIADRMTGKAPSAPLTGVRLAARSPRYDGQKARTELGFTVRPLEESLGDAISWLRERDLAS